MVVLRSHDHLEIIINGHRLTGFADEDQPYEHEFPVIVESTTGADGKLYGKANAAFGVILTVRLNDVSPSLGWAFEQRTMLLEAIRRGGAIPVINGSINDLNFGVSGRYQNGHLEGNFPGFPMAAQSTNELMFKFEEWIGNTQGGQYEAPPT